MTYDDLKAFRDWLQGQLAAEKVVSGILPDAPDRCIAVMDYPGPPTPNWRALYRCQIRCRGPQPSDQVSAYKVAHDLADSIIAVVAPPQDDPVIVTLAGGRKAIMRLTSGPMPMGADDKDRWEFSINVSLDVSRV